MARAEMTVSLKDLPEFKELVARAASAEAAIERVRALQPRNYDAEGYGCVLLTDVLYALNGPEPNFPPIRTLDGTEPTDG